MKGPGSEYCNYGDLDLLGGWVTGVVTVFILDAAIVAGLLLMSAMEAEHGRPDRDGGPPGPGGENWPSPPISAPDPGASSRRQGNRAPAQS
jgi:hypothetical protein